MTTTETEYNPTTNAFGHGLFLEEGGVKRSYHFYDAIDFFDETHEGDFLSNFYVSPLRLSHRIVSALLSDRAANEAQVGGMRTLADIEWQTGEHAFQAFKADSYAQVLDIATARGPGMAKSLGRRCDMRADWPSVRGEVMRQVLAAKFMPGSDLAERLLATDTQVLIEGTMWHDRIWGVYEGEGQNLLGVLLMEQRGYLKAVRDGR